MGGGGGRRSEGGIGEGRRGGGREMRGVKMVVDGIAGGGHGVFAGGWERGAFELGKMGQ